MKAVLTLLTAPGVGDEERDCKASEALHAAAASGQNGAIADLVASLKVPIGAPDGDGRTTLHHAACNNFLDTARYLGHGGHVNIICFLVKECGANVDIVDRKGETPLIAAARNGSLDTVRTLIKGCGAAILVHTKVPIISP